MGSHYPLGIMVRILGIMVLQETLIGEVLGWGWKDVGVVWVLHLYVFVSDILVNQQDAHPYNYVEINDHRQYDRTSLGLVSGYQLWPCFPLLKMAQSDGGHLIHQLVLNKSSLIHVRLHNQCW